MARDWGPGMTDWSEFPSDVRRAADAVYISEPQQMLGDLFDSSKTVEQLVEVAWASEMRQRFMAVPGGSRELARAMQARLAWFMIDVGRVCGLV